MTDRNTSRPQASTAAVRERVLAYVVDLIAVGPPLFAAVARRYRSRRRRLVASAVGGTVVASLYHVFLEGTTGQTIGKRARGIEVARPDGRPPTVRAAAVRTLGRFVDFLPVGYLLGFAAIRLTERDQRVGDLLAGTVVVRAGDGSDDDRSAEPRPPDSHR